MYFPIKSYTMSSSLWFTHSLSDICCLGWNCNLSDGVTLLLRQLRYGELIHCPVTATSDCFQHLLFCWGNSREFAWRLTPVSLQQTILYHVKWTFEPRQLCCLQRSPHLFIIHTVTVLPSCSSLPHISTAVAHLPRLAIAVLSADRLSVWRLLGCISNNRINCHNNPIRVVLRFRWVWSVDRMTLAWKLKYSKKPCWSKLHLQIQSVPRN